MPEVTEDADFFKTVAVPLPAFLIGTHATRPAAESKTAAWEEIRIAAMTMGFKFIPITTKVQSLFAIPECTRWIFLNPKPCCHYPCGPGGVAEWSIASVLKTEVGKLTVGSNPTPSAILRRETVILSFRLAPQSPERGSGAELEYGASSSGLCSGTGIATGGVSSEAGAAGVSAGLAGAAGGDAGAATGGAGDAGGAGAVTGVVGTGVGTGGAVGEVTLVVASPVGAEVTVLSAAAEASPPREAPFKRRA